MLSTLKIFIITILLCLSSYAKWIEIKGEGVGEVISLKSFENKIFAVTQEGLYSSENNGETWEITNYPFSFYYGVPDFVKIKDVIYALTPNLVYYSRDNGEIWQDIGVRDLFYKHDFSDSMLVLVADSRVKIFSIDGEYELNDSLFVYTNSLLVVDSKKFLLSGDSGIYIFSKEANKWSYNFIDLGIRGSHHLRKIDSTIFITTENNVVISYDNGKTWNYYDTLLTRLTEGEGGEEEKKFEIFIIGNLVILHSNKGNLLSYDKGISWVKDTFNFFNFDEETFYYGKDNNIFIGNKSSNSFLLSVDGGITWNVKYVDRRTTSILLKDSLIIVGTSDGIMVSSDNGHTWEERNNGLPHKYLNTNVNAIGNTLMSISGNKLFLLTNNNNVFKWDTINSTLPFTNPNYVVVYKERIYVGANNNIFYSDNKGKNWNLFPLAIPDKFDPPPLLPVILDTGYRYIGNIIPFGETDIVILIRDRISVGKSLRYWPPKVKILYLSKDGGKWDESWEILHSSNSIFSELIGVEKDNKKMLYGLMRTPSTKFIDLCIGEHLRIIEMSNPQTAVCSVGTTYLGPLVGLTYYRDYVLALSGYCGIVGYNINDTTWRIINSQYTFSQLAVSPNALLAIDDIPGGIYISSDTAKTWKKINSEGIPQHSIPQKLYVAGENVFLVTSSLNCARMFVKPLSEIYEEAGIVSTQFKPFTKLKSNLEVKLLNVNGKNRLIIKFPHKENEKLEIEMFNLTGVKTYKIRSIITGKDTYLFDIKENISNGNYILRIKNGKNVYLKKIQIVK